MNVTYVVSQGCNSVYVALTNNGPKRMRRDGWTPCELAAIKDIPRYVRANYKSIPALRHRTKTAIARKRYQLRKGAA